jgi:Tol biopolymer transport system component
VNLTGSAVTRLTTDPGDDFSPVWSLDGKSIFFIRSQLNVLNSPSGTVGAAIMATFPK